MRQQLRQTLRSAGRVLRRTGAVLGLLFLVVIVLPFVVISALVTICQYCIHWFLFIPRVRREWHSRGIYILWVYSNSPNWKPYCDEHILPRIREHAVILNWSQRRHWWDTDDLAVTIFKSYGNVRRYRDEGGFVYDGEDFCPMAVVLPRSGRPEVLRFYGAFRDLKKGHPERLEALQHRLDELVRPLDQLKLARIVRKEEGVARV
jgi:hypothetical protein